MLVTILSPHFINAINVLLKVKGNGDNETSLRL